MKLIKRIVPTLLICLLVFSSLGIASPPHWAQREMNDFLRQNYLIDIYKVTPTKKPNDGLTRAEFVSLMMRAFNIYPKDKRQTNALSSFSDLTGHWSEAVVTEAVQKGLIEGYSDGTFKPSRIITRAEVTALLVRALYDEWLYRETPFTDIKNHWADHFIGVAYDEQLIKGVGNSLFSPNRTITLAEGVTILHRIKEMLSEYEIVDIVPESPLKENETTTLKLLWKSEAPPQLDHKVFWGVYDGKMTYHMGENIEWRSDLPQPIVVKAGVRMNKIWVNLQQVVLQVQPQDETILLNMENIQPFVDTDGDGLSDKLETVYSTNPIQPDTDNDGLSDYFEIKYRHTGLDPVTPDTDGNEVQDGEEDFEQDGLINKEEHEYNTRPDLSDTDGDGLNDHFEVTYAYKDLLHPLYTDINNNVITDGQEDYDLDGLTNLEEQQWGTSPFEDDTDGDGLKDYDEIFNYKTDPTKQDSDGDEVSDSSEIKLGTDSFLMDTDGDGLPDGQEKFSQTSESIEVTEGLSVYIQMEATGDIDRTTKIHAATSNPEVNKIEGLIGLANIQTQSKFDEATIVFSYDPSKIKNIEDLKIAYINPLSQEIEFLESTRVDKQKHTISATTTHFSIYGVIDTKQFLKAWSIAPFDPNLLEEGAVDYAFLIDNSEDMAKGDFIEEKLPADPGNLRIKETQNYIRKQMNSLDRAMIIDFADTPLITVPLTSDKSQLTKGLSSLKARSKATNIKAAIETAIQKLSEAKSGVKRTKAIILISNGVDNVNRAEAFEETVQKANINQIPIYSIGLGPQFVDKSLLRKLSEETGGSYYLAKDSNEMNNRLFFMSNRLSNDKDRDGIPDTLEAYGMIQWNGTIVRTNTSSSLINGKALGYDTDQDQLSDGYEMRFVDLDGRPTSPDLRQIKIGSQIIQYFSNLSDPSLADSDGDNYLDLQDLKPLEPYITPIVLLHGITSNTLNVFGVSNTIANDDDEENNEEFNAKNIETDNYYTNVENQLIKGDYDKEKLYGYLLDTFPEYVPRKSFQAVGPQRQLTIFAYNYPNRAHTEISAKLLNRYLKRIVSTGYHDQPTKEGKPKVIFLVHSMGGLIARYYNEQIENKDKAMIPAGIITMATPHWGGDYIAQLNILIFDAQTELNPDPETALYFYTPLPVKVPFTSQPIKSFTEKLNEGFNKHSAKYFAVSGVSVRGFNAPSLYYYDRTEGPDFEEHSKTCLNRVDPTLTKRRPYFWNDPYVRLNSGLGSSAGLNTPFTPKPKVLDFDSRYVVVSGVDQAGHSQLYNNSEVRKAVVYWLQQLSPHMKTNLPLSPAKNLCNLD